MKYKIIVDKQNRDNPSTDKKEYEIDIEELHFRGNIYDSLIITKDEDYVMRRLKKNEYNALNVLEEPIKEPLQNINVELFEGDNYIYLLDMVGNKLCAEYLIKNDFTDTYVTKNEMNSAINQTAGQIELIVNQKLIEYATEEQLEGAVTELNSTITQKADEITSTVSSTYTTKDELSTAKSQIKQTTDSIGLEVNKKVDNSAYTPAQILLMINNDESEVKIKGDKIDIDGKAVKFKTNIATDYYFTEAEVERIKDAIINGDLTKEEKELYDINGNGKVNLADVQLMLRAVLYNNGYINLRGTLEIDPYSGKRTIVLRNEDEEIVTSIGLHGIQSENLGAKTINTKSIEVVENDNSANVNIVANDDSCWISMENRNNAGGSNSIYLTADDENAEISLSNSENSKHTTITPGNIEIQSGSYGFKVPEILHGNVFITPSAANTPTRKGGNI